ncbi:MAG: T9SS type A sorting domain-containing protein, partial [Candidatus Zophobacter franzmannii]|nr:T9SS type A sorting domain-containing protein [Candidatus Zophobacter franzmannii]
DNQLDIITELSGNYPNPFNPTTTISYSVASNNENVEIAIYDIRGRRIRTLINKQISRGEHEIIWDGNDENSQSVASGVYFYRLSTESKTISKKMVLLK